MKYPFLGFLAVVLFLLLGNTAHAASTLIASGSISEDTIWIASSSPYVITETLVINQGVTLTLEKGVIVKLGENGVVINGVMRAEGTEAEPVFITSIKDDTVGGDTNGDGSNTSPSSGNWQGLLFNAGASGTFDHAVIRYAGYGYYNYIPQISAIHNRGADVVIRDSELAYNQTCAVGQSAGYVVMEHSNAHDLICGVVALGGSVQLHNNQIKNTGRGLFMNGADTIEFTNNIFESNQITADINLSPVLSFVHEGNSAIGGQFNGIIVRGVLPRNLGLTKDTMPYIISGAGGSGGSGGFQLLTESDLAVGGGAALTLDPGVIIKFHDSAQLIVNGELSVLGEHDEPISFTSIKDDFIGGDTNGDGAVTAPANGDWAHVQFNADGEGAFKNAIIKYGGWNTALSGIGSGANIYNKGGIVTVRDSELAFGKSAGILHSSGTTTVNQSVIHDNSNYGVSNSSSKVLDATNNYWGDPSGPYHYIQNITGQGNAVSDNVLFNPWKGTHCTEKCFSSVVFLPGIKGSVLKKHGLVGEDTLWPSTLYSDDVAQLALTEEGVSINDVFVDGIVNKYITEPVYEPFSTFMNNLVATGTIVAWKPIPYDWRFLPETILEDGVKTRDGVVDVIDQIETLAESSNTGKVTIVAHSMGGLMGKAIIKKLQEEGKDNLIDSFVMVGSPQLGTPQAIASLLHGNGEGIPGDLEGIQSILNNSSVEPSAARQMAQNMPSAYNLLPSQNYFSAVNDPVLKFDESAAFTSDWRAFWGTAINTYTNFAQFITGQGISRINPTSGQLNIPEVLNIGIVDKVKDFHQEYDSYEFPSHINVIEIAGWGRPTLKSVLYTTEHNKQAYNPIFTSEGDNTVAYLSAISSDADETYFIDQNKYLDSNNNPVGHKDLLSTLPVQKIIASIVKEESISNINFISTTRPEIANIKDKLLVSSHSPVVLGAHDSQGNFTGIDIAGKRISEEIPGSSVRIFGQDQFIFLPKVGTYNFLYKGTGTGSTTIKIEKFSHEIITPIVTYTDIPTVLNTVATFEVNSLIPENTEIKLDKNSDGIVDLTVKADGTDLSLIQLVSLLKTTINSLNLQKQQKQSLLLKVILLEQVITIKNKDLLKLGVNLNVGLIKFEVELLKKSGKISAQDATTIFNLLTKITQKV